MATPSPSPTPAKTADIKRAKLDVVYSALVDQDVHKVSSKKALEAGLDAVRALARDVGGKDDVATPAFQDVAEPVNPDFRKFADAVSQIALGSPRLSAERIAETAILAMIRTSPDCHTYYVSGGRRNDSRPVQETGSANPPLPAGRNIAGPDEARLQARVLDGGVVYIRFTEFRITGTYDIRTEVRKVLDKGIAEGAKAWLFDLRGNVGGNGAEILASYFLSGEPAMRVQVRTGNAGTSSANAAFRLPKEYQLPMAVVVNDRGGSGPEVFTLFLKENKRATVVGQRTIGCLGATSPTTLSDGSEIFVVTQEFVGAVTGTAYNNLGIPPDIEADDATAVDVAAQYLRGRIAAGK